MSGKKAAAHDVFDDFPTAPSTSEPAPLPRPGRRNALPSAVTQGLRPEGGSQAPDLARTPEERERSRSATSLLGNQGTAIDKIRSGETAQIVEKQVDPDLVDVWEGNPRNQDHLSAEHVEELAESIRSQGRLIPGVARRKGDRYELIYGSRRLKAIKTLKQSGYPEIKFRLQLRDINDEAAFRLADEENRNRSDISSIERALSYAAALKEHYSGNQSTMANKLGINRTVVSRLIKIASIPQEILSVIPDRNQVGLNTAHGFAVKLDDADFRENALRTASAIREEVDLGAVFPTEVVLKRLLDETRKDDRPDDTKILSNAGKPMIEVKRATKGGLTFKLYSNSGASADELMKSVREVAKQHGMI